MSEAFGENAHSQPGDITGERGPVVDRRQLRGLTGVVAVGSGKHGEEQRGVGDGACHRTDVIERPLHRERARVRDQPVRRLVSDDAAQRRGDPDRSTLIAAQGQLDLAGGHQCRTATG